MSIPVRRGDGVAGGVGLVGGASPRGDRASALDRVKTLKTRLIASVLQAASAILVQVALAACPRACRFIGSECDFYCSTDRQLTPRSNRASCQLVTLTSAGPPPGATRRTRARPADERYNRSQPRGRPAAAHSRRNNITWPPPRRTRRASCPRCPTSSNRICRTCCRAKIH